LAIHSRLWKTSGSTLAKLHEEAREFQLKHHSARIEEKRSTDLTSPEVSFDSFPIALYIEGPKPFLSYPRFQIILSVCKDAAKRWVNMLSNNLSQANDNSAEDDDGISQAGDANKRVEHLIEQLKLRTSELEEANRELRRISHYRSLFLARMSHELRTPLTSILGFSEILLDHEQLSATQRRFCQKIQASAFQLQTSLNQLVDLSRLEGGPTELFLILRGVGASRRGASGTVGIRSGAEHYNRGF
jgi:signal transduction histidine kinase